MLGTLVEHEKPGPRSGLGVTSKDVLSQRSEQLRANDHKVIPLNRSDAAIVTGLLREELWAANALYDRYAAPIERMLRRTLGYERHADFEDLLHEVFLQALTSAHQLRDSTALLAWLQTIAARIAFRTMRRRKARSWLRFREPEEVPEIEASDTPPEIREACESFYCLVDKLPATEQIVFNLRYVEGMDVAQVARVCDVSLSTAKRRLAKAEERFARLVGRDPILQTWIEEGSKWAP
jgi:RNA polymerase sigma-70 factor (ECF subfamily)